MHQAAELNKELTLSGAVARASALAAGDSFTLSGLYGSSKAYLLARLFVRTGRPMLVVLPTDEAASEFAADLNFFIGPDGVSLFPSPEVLPFERQSPHSEIVASRMELLYRLATEKSLVAVSSAANLMWRVMPRAELTDAVISLNRGGEFSIDTLLARLHEMGYARMSMVEERAEFSTRGGIVDIFPPMYGSPVRIEFFGDEIETIRTFDISTQRSKKDLTDVVILPAKETVMARQARLDARERLIERAESLGTPREEWEPLSDMLREGVLTHGAYSLLPLFYERLDSVFDYLGADTICCAVDPAGVKGALEEFSTEISASRERFAGRDKFFVDPDALFLPPSEAASILYKSAVIELEPMRGPGAAVTSKSNMELKQELAIKKGTELLAPLARTLEEWLAEDLSVYITAHNRGQAERTAELLSGYGLNPAFVSGTDIKGGASGGLSVATGALSTGFVLPSEQLVVVSEEEVFGDRVKRRGPPSRKLESFLTQLQDLSEGDFIVHKHHGVGLYRGLKRLDVDGVANDFLLLEYKGGDKLYLPVWRMDLVSKYHGVEGRSPDLDKLGGTGWTKTKKKVREAVEKLAGELLKLYAEREVAKGHAFTRPGPIFDEFEAAFEFEETPDQERAIEDCMKDMGGSAPMDRLICGDVGYGKTEVAIRAAFRAVLDGKQVAVLVPTTVLAEQHYTTFSRRLAPYPVITEVLSRFKSRKEQKEVAEKVRAGRADIVIGTHRLLQKDIEFKDLGLIVIDEEHRFGVAHKERLKQMRKKVDVLTLTATPIPRTLHMSMAGVRELSIISTAPHDRLAIKTIVTRFDESVIAEAIERELARDGQIFFVHNRIQSIGAMEDMLNRLVPRARVAVAHGRMKEGELEKRMVGFVNRDYDILLSTAIIESGLDIPSANTIIINRADRFGLAELYQLRGRVGRSKHRAYAYFICPEIHSLTDEARKRIEVLQELTDPGSGFKIAAHDLEIRGAGELLGAAQSGRIAEVGFDLYCSLLEEAVAELKGEDIAEELEPEINLRVSQYIPEEYVPDTRQRLGIYKRLASVTSEDGIISIMDELTDRYGDPPQLVDNLMHTAELKLALRRLKARELTQKGTRLYLTFAESDGGGDGDRVVENAFGMVEREPKHYRINPDGRFIVYMPPGSTPFDEARYMLKELSRGCYI